jgi:hypothetical protein
MSAGGYPSGSFAGLRMTVRMFYGITTQAGFGLVPRLRMTTKVVVFHFVNIRVFRGRNHSGAFNAPMRSRCFNLRRTSVADTTDAVATTMRAKVYV